MTCEILHEVFGLEETGAKLGIRGRDAWAELEKCKLGDRHCGSGGRVGGCEGRERESKVRGGIKAIIAEMNLTVFVVLKVYSQSGPYVLHRVVHVCIW